MRKPSERGPSKADQGREEGVFYSRTLQTWGGGLNTCTAVSSEAWAKLREWAILAGKGRLLLSGSVVLASLKAAV